MLAKHGLSCAHALIHDLFNNRIKIEVFSETEVSADALIEEYTEMYKSLNEKNLIGRQLEELKQKIELKSKMKKKLLEYNVTGRLPWQALS